MLAVGCFNLLVWSTCILVGTSAILLSDGILNDIENLDSNAANFNLTGPSSIYLQWTADAEKYGVLEPTSMYMSGIQALYKLGLQDWEGYQGLETIKFRDYHGVEIQIMPLQKREGNLFAFRWSVIIAVFRIMAIMYNALAYTGGVAVVKVQGRPEVNITFSSSKPSEQTLASGSLQEITARSSMEGLNTSNYRTAFRPLNDSDRLTSLTNDIESLGGEQKFFADWYGAPLSPDRVFMTIAASMMKYVHLDKGTVAKPIDSAIPLHIVIKQYYGPDSPSEFADRQMKVEDALLGLRKLARTAVKMSKFQEMAMIMERRKDEPIGVFNISKPLVGFTTTGTVEMI